MDEEKEEEWLALSERSDEGWQPERLRAVAGFAFVRRKRRE